MYLIETLKSASNFVFCKSGGPRAGKSALQSRAILAQGKEKKNHT